LCDNWGEYPLALYKDHARAQSTTLQGPCYYKGSPVLAGLVDLRYANLDDVMPASQASLRSLKKSPITLHFFSIKSAFFFSQIRRYWIP
jgi:hypothetical protein